jgi:MFS family permease
VTADPSVATAQRHALRVLVGTQVLGGLGVSAGIAVGTLLASRVLGREDLAGFVQSAQVLGSALLAVPAARLSVSYGRRVGLGLGYGLAVLGALLCVLAAETGSFPLLLVGSALFGGGSTAGLQARYAATDLAEPGTRGRALSTVVWATTVGAVVGPNLVGLGGWVGGVLGVEELAGPYLLGAAALALAATGVLALLRPDPLLLARERAGTPPPVRGRRGVLRPGLRAAATSPPALLGLAAVVVGHTAMVTVMVMTPIHMDHGHASLTVIGMVISVHVLGMYAFAPIVGVAVDRIGRVPVIVAGGVVLLLATALAGASSAGASPALWAGLFLLGVGWSCCLIAGSTLLTDEVPIASRPVVQGMSDLLMGLVAAVGGAAAGLVMAGPGFLVLNVGAAMLVGVLLAIAAIPACRPRSNTRSR